MMLPSVFGENLFDDVFDDFWGFPSFDDKAMRKAERKLYGHHAAKMMKWILTCLVSRRMRLLWN